MSKVVESYNIPVPPEKGRMCYNGLAGRQKKGERTMKQDQPKPSLKTILAAELFDKLPDPVKDQIIAQLKDLLSKQ